MATPLSVVVTGANVAARAPSSRALIVTDAPGTTAPDESTTVTISRPSWVVWATAVEGKAMATSSASHVRWRMGTISHSLHDRTINSAPAGRNEIGLFIGQLSSPAGRKDVAT